MLPGNGTKNFDSLPEVNYLLQVYGLWSGNKKTLNHVSWTRSMSIDPTKNSAKVNTKKLKHYDLILTYASKIENKNYAFDFNRLS